MSGKLITLEGIDGAGKSTLMACVVELLSQHGHEVVISREPGGTELGEKLRAILLHESMHPETETLLMFAARREHIARVIAPALSRGAYVVSDRFTDASYAYQGGGKLVDDAKIELLETWVQSTLRPDLTLLFDLPVEVSMQRLHRQQILQQVSLPDKFERESNAFMQAVRQKYLLQARLHANRLVVIDANQALHRVKQDIEKIITDKLAP